MTDAISHLFATHEQARHTASLLDQAGIPHDQVSLLDQHRDGQGGTLMTVRVLPGQAGLVTSLLPGTSGAVESAPNPDLAGLHDAAPAYVAGGTANLGTSGPD